MSLTRLDKLIAASGLTRSEAAAAIRAGRVAVGGAVITAPETKVEPERGKVTLDGAEILTGLVYIMMNKPAGYVSATEDARERCVTELLPQALRRRGVAPAGRLDKDTEGLLLLTDDGQFAHRVISPRHNVRKLYRAEVEGVLDESDAEAFRQGIVLGDGTRCLSAELTIEAPSTALVAVREGKYHQVKRMLASRGKPVRALRRLAVGGLWLDETLAAGEWRCLTEAERELIFHNDTSK
ncbi:MAG: 16S rRNA pseudouridine(516) synthase [Oscillospiraceae bacterium]|nr:16S rRNA pseudouridine(516) synthase [Oscillospiraceae bacterium]